MGGNVTIREFAHERISHLLGRLAFEVRRGARSRDADAVHDLRVAIRRFTESLRTFRNLLPRGAVSKARRRLKEVMALAGEVRNRDIALELFRAAGVESGSPLTTRQAAARDRALVELQEALRRLHGRGFSSRWRTNLRLAR